MFLKSKFHVYDLFSTQHLQNRHTKSVYSHVHCHRVDYWWVWVCRTTRFVSSTGHPWRVNPDVHGSDRACVGPLYLEIYVWNTWFCFALVYERLLLKWKLSSWKSEVFFGIKYIRIQKKNALMNRLATCANNSFIWMFWI